MKKDNNILENDTIAAIATAPSNSAISIVRLSGNEAIDIVNNIFKGKDLKKVKSHTINYGHIVYNNEYIDEVLVSIFKSPKTFTREDVVEINCHGGIYVTNKILEILLINGARLADPGEFTKRAFLNGRIDLTQAEAVIDIIESNTSSSLKMANLGILGETKKVISDYRDRILETIALSSRINAFNKLDLPTLGLPMIAVLIPYFIILDTSDFCNTISISFCKLFNLGIKISSVICSSSSYSG